MSADMIDYLIACAGNVESKRLAREQYDQLLSRAAEADALRAELKRTDALLNKAADGEELATLERDYRPRTDEYERVCEERDQLCATVSAQAQTIETARRVLHDYEIPQDKLSFSLRELACIIPADQMIWHAWIIKQAEVIDAWLAANAPTQTQGETESEK